MELFYCFLKNSLISYFYSSISFFYASSRNCYDSISYVINSYCYFASVSYYFYYANVSLRSYWSFSSRSYEFLDASSVCFSYFVSRIKYSYSYYLFISAILLRSFASCCLSAASFARMLSSSSCCFLCLFVYSSISCFLCRINYVCCDYISSICCFKRVSCWCY